MKMLKKILLSLCLTTFAFHSEARDYNIYPIPQSIAFESSQSISLKDGVNIVCEKGIDAYTRQRAAEILKRQNIPFAFSEKISKKGVNLLLGINGSKKIADAQLNKMSVSRSVFSKDGKFDRHIISVGVKNNKNYIVIVGEHTNAVFFGLASLEQILEQSTNNVVSSGLIEDYADMQYRGIVEGYYGYPYSFASKTDLMEFFKRYKMNTYLYGAKSDPYHSGYWRDPYPESITSTQESLGWLSQQMIKDLSETALETKVNFIWAIHPNSGKSVSYASAQSTQQAVNDVLGKFDKMYNLGVRQFAVFLDDAGWDLKEVDNYANFLNDLQNGMELKYNKSYKQASDTVMPIHYVPHIYAINFASKDDRDIYFNAIQKTKNNIVVYTTGEGVWSTPTNKDFKLMHDHMNRKVALWWNYPCNDNKDGRLYTSDMVTNLREMGLGVPESDISENMGIVANPMQQGQVSKIGLFGVADYSWNTAAFKTKRNWDDSFEAIVGTKLAPAFHYAANYLRHDEPTAFQKNCTDFLNTDKASSVLTAQLDSIKWSCEELQKLQFSNVKSDQLLWIELAPWVKKLKEMADIALTYIKTMSVKDNSVKWNNYLEIVKRIDSLSTRKEFMVETLEGMGENPPKEWHNVEPSQKTLYPFLISLKEKAFGLVEPVQAEKAKIIENGGIENISLHESNNEVYFETSENVVLSNQSSVCFSLPYVVQPEQFVVNQNALKGITINYSADGKTWKRISKAGNKQQDWVKYIRLVNLNKKSVPLKLNKKNLCVTLPQAAKISDVTLPEGKQIWFGHDGKLMIDGNPETFMTLNANQEKGDIYQIKLDTMQRVFDVRAYIGTTNNDFMEEAQIQLSKDGSNWVNLVVDGTNQESFSLSMPQAKEWSENVKYIDFNGQGQIARFVRIVNTKPNIHKWLRIHEISVNEKFASERRMAIAETDTRIPLSELVDGKASTSHEFTGGSLIYHLVSLTPAKALRIYSDATPANTAKIRISSDGKTYTTLGELNSGIQTIDLSGNQNSTTLIVDFGSKPTHIYEVEELK